MVFAFAALFGNRRHIAAHVLLAALLRQLDLLFPLQKPLLLLRRVLVITTRAAHAMLIMSTEFVGRRHRKAAGIA